MRRAPLPFLDEETLVRDPSWLAAATGGEEVAQPKQQ
jgi:hypothetical protein